MCKSHCSTFILWAGQQGLECYIPVIIIIISFFFFYTQTYLQPPGVRALLGKNKDTYALWFYAVVIQFFRDTLNNHCRLQSDPYSPYPSLRDIKHQLLCQILFGSREWQVGHTNEASLHRHTHTGSRTNWSPKRTQALSHLPPSSPHKRAVLHAQMHIHPQKQSFFERESRGEGGR